jgi:hypothetical protein
MELSRRHLARRGPFGGRRFVKPTKSDRCDVARNNRRSAPRKISAVALNRARRVTFAAKWLLCARALRFALVAQLDRASDFESEGRGFESLRARQK